MEGEPESCLQLQRAEKASNRDQKKRDVERIPDSRTHSFMLESKIDSGRLSFELLEFGIKKT